MSKIIFMKQGFTDAYPHADFERPCTCAECCMDKEHGYIPRCGVCDKPLKQYGLCTECVGSTDPTVLEKVKIYMLEN